MTVHPHRSGVKPAGAQPTKPSEDSQVNKAAHTQPRGPAAPPANTAAELAAASVALGKGSAGGFSDGLRAPPKEARHGQWPGEVGRASSPCNMQTAHYNFNL